MANCNYLPVDLYREAVETLAKEAKGPPIVLPKPSGSGVVIDDEDGTTAHPSKRTKTAGTTPMMSSASSSSIQKGSLSGYVTEGKKALKERADNALTLLIACNGIPPRIVDSAEFKRYSAALNSNYQPPSATTLSEKLVTGELEAARIDCAIHEFLKGCRDLTITFDGGKARSQKGFYTVHITTADRRTFCMDLDDASTLSHTARYIKELLDRVSANSRCLKLVERH